MASSVRERLRKERAAEERAIRRRSGGDPFKYHQARIDATDRRMPAAIRAMMYGGRDPYGGGKLDGVWAGLEGVGATRSATHYFDREDTALVPEIVADTVVGEIERAFTDEGLSDRDEIIAALVDRARATYSANERFAKKIRSNANRGNAGRDHLYVFMRHWLSGELDRRHPSIFRQLPDEFKMGRELSATGRWGHPFVKLRRA